MKANLEDAKYVLKTLNGAGYEAYLAGGCVRDRILGIEPSDYDITTSATPTQVQAIFPKTLSVGAAFGVVKVLRDDNCELDVATFRIDGDYTDNRRPDSVAFTTSAQEDVKRRDFTINALLMDIDGKVIDYVGGQEDLKSKTLRAVGDPTTRFYEDPLRMLRAIRFSIKYGLNIEVNTWKSIQALYNNILKISKERITEELTKILILGNCDVIYTKLMASKMFDLIRGYTHGTPRVTAMSRIPPGEDFIVCLMVTFGLDYRLSIPQFILLTNEQRDKLKALTDITGSLMQYLKLPLHTQRKVAYSAHIELACKLISYWGVGELFNYSYHDYNVSQLEIAKQVNKKLLEVRGMGWPDPIMNGKILLEMGYVSGPDFSTVLDDVRDKQLDLTLKDLEQAKEYVKNTYTHLKYMKDDQLIDPQVPQQYYATCGKCNTPMYCHVPKDAKGKPIWDKTTDRINISQINSYRAIPQCHYQCYRTVGKFKRMAVQG